MGLSSREPYTFKTPYETLDYFINFIEAFRVACDITEFYLVGHLLGGYLSSFYANKYPKHVKKQV